MSAARIVLVFSLLVGNGTQAHAGPIHFLKKLFGGQRAAAPTRPRRAHLLTEQLAARLKPETQQNVYSLAHYAGPVAYGSATVVGAWTGKRGKLRALVLANHHVVDKNHDKSTVLSFMDGTQSTKSKIVAQSRFLDYALLEVELPDTAQIQPVRLRSDFLHAGEKVYALGAATSMTDFKVRDFLSVAHADQVQRVIDRGEMPEHMTLSAGRMLDDGPAYYKIANKQRVFQQETDLAITHGASGGPVFSTKTHELVALNASGGRSRDASFAGVTTMPYIMYDLGKKLQRGLIAPRFQDTLGTLLSEAPQPTNQ